MKRMPESSSLQRPPYQTKQKDPPILLTDNKALESPMMTYCRMDVVSQCLPKATEKQLHKLFQNE